MAKNHKNLYIMLFLFCNIYLIFIIAVLLYGLYTLSVVGVVSFTYIKYPAQGSSAAGGLPLYALNVYPVTYPSHLYIELYIQPYDTASLKVYSVLLLTTLISWSSM